jgi:ribonuclease HI
MKYIIHTDGGSRGNPGPAAVGIEIKEESSGKIFAAFGKKIGVTTNNVAEYTAVITALNYMIDHQMLGSELQFLLDSTLVVNQLNGLFKVKDSNMRNLMMKVRELEQVCGGIITYSYVPREQNSDADYQVNKALDS